MSIRAKPTIIGIFVSGAAVLAIAAVLMFGGGKVFNHQEKFIIYFADSVNGLQVGSAVKYKGVQIGQVSSILITYDQNPQNDDIPVIIEIDTTHLHRDLGDTTDLSDPKVFEDQIRQGLRARLQMQSFVTFQLYIELDYVGTGIPPKPVGLSHIYKEIPSIPAGLSEVVQSISNALENLSKVDFADMANKINHLADELTTGVDQLNFKEINDNLVAAGKNLNALLADPKIKEALDKLGSTLDDLNQLASSINGQVQPLSQGNPTDGRKRPGHARTNQSDPGHRARLGGARFRPAHGIGPNVAGNHECFARDPHSGRLFGGESLHADLWQIPPLGSDAPGQTRARAGRRFPLPPRPVPRLTARTAWVDSFCSFRPCHPSFHPCILAAPFSPLLLRFCWRVVRCCRPSPICPNRTFSVG